jgi:oligopeptide/dipeptide ABC transporter ATP-binding protein
VSAAAIENALAQAGLPAEISAQRIAQVAAPLLPQIALAQALLNPPQLLIWDAPSAPADDESAAAMLARLLDLQRAHAFALVYTSRSPELTHGLERVMVLHLGTIMERASGISIWRAARHPCTRMLVEKAADGGSAEVPVPSAETESERPHGCVFHPRCALAESPCVRAAPHLVRVGPEHYAACHFVAAA